MLTINHEAKKYRINFKYERESDKTVCFIYDSTDNKNKVLLATGIARKSHLDKHFDKNQGRKHSLEKALNIMNISKEFRKEIWKEYFNLRHHKF